MKEIISELYNIKAEPKIRMIKHIRIEDFDANLPFDKEPEPEEIIGLLKLLRPETEYFLGSVRIKYLQEINIA